MCNGSIMDKLISAVFTNLFIGISLGANVLGARFYAAGRDKEMSETVHTAITLALISGIAMAFIGVLFARGALELMGTPDDVIRLSTLYMRIYFCGMPFFMLYNYGAAILRAVGDTKRPLIFLLISGSTNAVLNLVMVIKFDLGVAGVGIATVISQMISCVLVLRCLHKSDSSYQLRFSKLKIKKAYMLQIFQVGIPAGIQSTVINLSNVLLQSSVNSFGSTAMAGYTAANNLFGFLYVSVNSVTQACMSFTSWCVCFWPGNPADLYYGSCGYPVCDGNPFVYHSYLFFMWSYGSVSGSIAWNGTFSSTDDSVRDRNGRYPYCLDLWYFPTAQVIGDLVYLLSGILDPYDRDAGDLLLLRAAACTPHPCGTAFMSK